MVLSSYPVSYWFLVLRNGLDPLRATDRRRRLLTPLAASFAGYRRIDSSRHSWVG